MALIQIVLAGVANCCRGKQIHHRHVCVGLLLLEGAVELGLWHGERGQHSVPHPITHMTPATAFSQEKNISFKNTSEMYMFAH